MDIKEVLASEAGKAAIAAAVEEATKGLKAKNEELLGKLAQGKDKLSEYEAKAKELEDKQKQAEQEAAIKSGDMDKIIQSHKDQMAKKDETIESLRSGYNKEVVDRTFTEALVKAGVVNDLVDDVRTILKARSTVEITDEGARIEGKSIEEFVSEWSQGDSAKRYMAAADNSGGGANGANGGGKAMAGKSWGEMKTTKDKVQYLKSKGE